MESLWSILPFLTVLAIWGARTYYKKAWDKVQRPLLVALSVGSAAVTALLLCAVVLIVQKEGLSVAGKTLTCAEAAAMIGLFVWINVACWKKWKREQQN